jgi:hypothetical protein
MRNHELNDRYTEEMEIMSHNNIVDHHMEPIVAVTGSVGAVIATAIADAMQVFKDEIRQSTKYLYDALEGLQASNRALADEVEALTSVQQTGVTQLEEIGATLDCM